MNGLGADKQNTTTPVTHLQVELPEGKMLAFGRRVPNTIGVAPDGRTIAVAVADRGSSLDYYTESTIDTRLWLRSLDAEEGRIVAGSDGAMQPFFSPDGRWVAFFARGTLRKALVAGGGVVETVCEADDPWGGNWSEEDTIVFSSSRTEGLVTQRVPAAGGTPVTMFELETATGEQEHNFPSLLPGGRSVLYMAWRAGETSFARTLVYDLVSGRRTTLVEGGLRPEFHPPYLLYNVGPRLFGAPMTVDPPALDGSSVELSKNLLVDPDYDAGQWSASPGGTLVYASGGHPQTDQELVWVGLDRSLEGILESEKTIRSARIAGDERILFANIDVNADIFAHDLSRGTTRRLTVDPTWDGTPVPSRRGDRIAFSSYRAGSEQFFIIQPDGAITQPLEAEGTRFPTSWSRDDRWLAYTDRNPSTMTDIWLLAMDEDDTEPFPLVATSATEGEAAFSPVADVVAYVSDESGSPEVWMRSFPAKPGDSAQLVSSGGGSGPLWARDGRQLFFHSGGGLVAVEVTYEPVLRLGQPRLVLDDPTLRVTDIASDGRLLAIKSKPMPEVTTLNVILGFDRLLQKSSN
jgi:serine/threonine-protein kinase